MTGRLILLKHGHPVLEGGRPPSRWRLSPGGRRATARWAAAAMRRGLHPAALLSSPEPKATATAAILARGFGGSVRIDPDLREIARDAAPIQSDAARQAHLQAIFVDRSRAVAGPETGAAAARRFRGALHRAARLPIRGDILLVTHGTVMALALCPGPAAFPLWRRLRSLDALAIPRAAVRAHGTLGNLPVASLRVGVVSRP